MENTKKHKLIRSFAGLVVAILLFFSSGLRLPVLDSTTDDYFNEAINTASAAYLTCRVVNASTSIFKDSSLNLEPAGVGVTLALGQALDPIDDMAERLSDVLVTAITSLGVQKLAFDIGVSIAPPILAIFLFTFSILIWFENDKLTTIQKNIMRIIFLILIVRFALPISAFANNYIQEHFFADNISNAKQELTAGAAELDKLKEFSFPKIDSIWGTIKNNASLCQHKFKEFKDAFAATVDNSGKIVENLLKLAYLYVGVFLIQVIALPIMVFWLLVKFTNSLFDSIVPVILHHPRQSKR